MVARVVLVVALALSAFGCNTAEFEARIAALELEKAQVEKQLQSLRGENARLERRAKASEQELASLKEAAERLKSRKSIDEVRATLNLLPGQKVYATFVTSMGDLVAELYVDQTPATIENFVQLAEGTKEWTDPTTKKKVKRPLYRDTVFHRVIPGFMVQGGDPLGTGSGGPGYDFEDEIVDELRHTEIGILSMANRGPNTNGSQFFITEVATPHLDGKHTVFGKVIENAELVLKMTGVEKMTSNPRDSRPKEPIVLKDVLIGRGKPKR